MLSRKHKLGGVAAVVGAAMVIVGYVSQVKEIISWGLPIWAWQSIGAVIFFASLGWVLWEQQKKIDALCVKEAKPEAEEVASAQNPESFVFPYIMRLDASQLQQGKD